jgi:uncharacterized protein YdeI (YjbR/CyaY-like superfamily)
MADEQIAFATPAEWQDWLAAHHEESAGVYIKIAKKHTGIESISHAGSLEPALAHGWIDGRARRLDASWYLQWFGPRRRGSKWSKINRATVERLTADGAMTPAGLRAVEEAKANGNWEAAYASPRSITVPDDLQAELDRHPSAAELFGKLSGQNRYAILYRIQEAKRPDTRARRITKFVAMLDAGETIYPQ